MPSAMQAASSAAESVQETVKRVALPLQLWPLSRQLTEVVAFIDAPAAPASKRKKTEPVDLRLGTAKLDSLIASLDRLYTNAHRRRFTNRTLFGTQLRHIHRDTEKLRDFSELLHLVIDPRTPAAFETARQERKEEGTVAFSDLF